VRTRNHAAALEAGFAEENGGAALFGSEADVAEAAAAEQLRRLPAKLLNNAAVLHMRGGEPGAALDLMQEAIQVHNHPFALMCSFPQSKGACRLCQQRQHGRTQDLASHGSLSRACEPVKAWR
jgi:hypothetical protein